MTIFVIAMRKLLSIILLLLLVWPTGAQTDSLRLGFSVRGRVVDARTGRPLESVHISIPGRHQATVTNAEGDFVLKSDRAFEWIECSFLGYKTRRLSAEDGVTVRLSRENLQLTEASIVSGDPQTLLLTALDKLWDNYCKEPELLECFYRETVQKRSRYTYVRRWPACTSIHTTALSSAMPPPLRRAVCW